MEAKVVLRGVIAYNEAAKRQLAEQFKTTNTGREVLLTEGKPTQFALRFSYNDKLALSTFLRLLHKFPEEVDELKRSGVETKFVRLRSTVAEVDDGTSESDESYAAVNKTEGSLLIDDNAIERIWSTGTVDAHLARNIGNVTKCSIEQNLDSDGMLVKGYNEADVEKAMAKLEVVFKFTQQQQSFPITSNFQISEGEIQIYLQIVPLGTLRDRLITTLVPPHLVKKLSSQLIVVMMSGQQTLPLGRSNPPGSFDIESLLWKEHPLRFFGQTITDEHTVDQKKSVEQPEKARYRTLSEWVDESSTAIPSTDPFVPLFDELKEIQFLDKKQSAEEVIKEDIVTQVSLKKRFVKTRKPKGAVQKIDMEAVKGKVDEVFSLDTQLSTSQNILVLSGRSEQQPEPSFAASTEEAEPLYEASADNSQEKKEYLPTTTSICYDELWNLQPPNAPNIQAPYMPARSTISEAPSNPNSEACWAYSGVSAATEGNLIDILAPDAKQGKPKTQPKTQGSGNRHFKNTMNQRKPSGGSGPNPGQASVLKEYDDFAIYLLSLTQSRPGLVKLEVRIGRLMIDYQSGTTEWKKRPFAPGQWHDVFPNRSEMVKLESLMTERLTSMGSDIDYISHLKLHSNRNMFTPEPCERATFYRFTCASKLQSEDVIFDVYEDKTVHSRSMEILVGTLNIHFPKRYWDARIAVTLNEPIKDGHNETIRETVAKLRIGSAADEGCIKLDTDIDAKVLTFKSIELHRETCHRSTNYPDLLMRLSEVQDLHLDLNLSQLDGIQNCHAFTKPKKDMIGEMTLWWEVSVASVAATKMLEENKTLELGNTSTWKPSNITDALIVRNMSHLARDIVTRIDSVGCCNKGPKTSTSIEASEIAASNLGFW